MAYQVTNGKLTKVKRKLGNYSYSQVPSIREELKPVPNKIKGHYLGLCNRHACQSPEAVVWYNTGTHQYYCGHCAFMINMDGCQRYNQPHLCYKVTKFDKNYKPEFDPTVCLTRLRDYLPTKEERYE